MQVDKRKNMKITAKEDCNLLKLLGTTFPETSVTKLKKMIMYGCISYKGATIKSLEMLIRKGESIEYTKYSGGKGVSKQKTDLPIIFEDRNLIVVNKSCGVKFASEVSYKGKTICSMTKSYLKRKYGDAQSVFPVCQVGDYDSGLCVLARDKRSAAAISAIWNKITKQYVCIVRNDLLKGENGRFNNYILKGSGRVVSLKYRLAEQISLKDESLSVLEVIQTEGNMKDCRELFNEIGNPIVADCNFDRAAMSNNFSKICMNGISFRHPATGRVISLEIAEPRGFRTVNQ